MMSHSKYMVMVHRDILHKSKRRLEVVGWYGSNDGVDYQLEHLLHHIAMLVNHKHVTHPVGTFKLDAVYVSSDDSGEG